MSTRCSITCKDDSGEFSLYRHSDGYPGTEHGVLETLKAALSYAWRLPRFEAEDFAAAIVAALKKPASGPYAQGGNIYLSHGRDSHGDTEYHYEITRQGNGVKVQSWTPNPQKESDWGKPRVWKKGEFVILTSAMQSPIPESSNV